MNGLYILNVKSSNYKSIYNINTKKFKSNYLNLTYFWHYHLGHINEKYISSLHKNELLDSFDFESFELCKFCLLWKMTNSLFSRKDERATKLLSLIHTDICGSMSSPARGSYQYFDTITNDFSRYSYV